MSSTHRRMHKGFPQTLTYLLRRPMEYSSHEFQHLNVDQVFRVAIAAVFAEGDRPETPRHRDDVRGDFVLRIAPKLHYGDYTFRLRALEDSPLYFLLSSCQLVKGLGKHSLHWVTLGDPRQCNFEAEPIRSRAFQSYRVSVPRIAQSSNIVTDCNS